MTGPIESGVSRCPNTIPSAAKGRRPRRISTVIRIHSFPLMLTPRETPAR
jgi:hypothetical protein